VTLLADLRFALRTWRKNPVPALAAVLTLAIGVGANTAIFSVIYAVMLKPLPYPDPERLVQIWSVDLDPRSEPGAMLHRDKQLLSVEEIGRLRATSHVLQDIGYYGPWMSNVSAPGEAERIYAAHVSPGLFPALRMAPAMGRAFAAADLAPGREHIAILSDAFWRRRFHGDPAILGQTVTVDGYPCTVVGVMSPGFRLIAPTINEQPDLMQPFPAANDAFGPEPAWTIARLRAGVPLANARAELKVLARQVFRHEPHQPWPRGFNLVPLDEEVASGIRPALLILFAAAGCVLLIACGNIASLVLAAASAREGELAVRTALGAPRSRLARQLLTESMALSAAGAAAGLLLSFWVVGIVAQLYPDRIPRLESLRPEPAVFAFTALLALATALLFGGLPAWRYSRTDLQQILRGSAAGGRRRSAGFRDLLMTAQIAAALVLLIGGGLLLRSFLLIRAIDPGYQRHNLLVAHLMLDDKTYSGPGQQAAFVQRLVERMNLLPGVEAAGATNSLPLEFNFLWSVTVGIEGHPELGDQTEIDCRAVTPHFLETMGIGLVAGRFLEPADNAVAGGVIVNQSFARRYFGAANPVGRRLYFGKEARAIVGVITDIKDLGLARKTLPAMYLPFDRQPTQFVDLAIRTRNDPRFLVRTVRRELRAIDPNQPLGKVTTMEDVLHNAVAKPRWYAILIGSFAGLAWLLASVGIYGAVAHAVSRRTHEIGIRMAIGARPADVLRMVLWRGMWPPVAGVVVGLPVAAAASKVLASVLYGVAPLDLRTYGAAAALVPVISLVAAYVPARRATQVDPIAALRCE